MQPKTLMTLTCMAVVSIAAMANAGDDLDIPWSTIDGGGGTSSGGGFTLQGTIGQHDAGPLAGGGFTIDGGFHVGGASCTGDINGDGAVDVLDLVQIILQWGSTSGPADVNGDGTVNVSDLIAVITSWGPCS